MNSNMNMREKIKEIFLIEAEKNKYSKVPVTTICQSARINRSTFYFYFESTEKLLDEIEYDFISQIPFVDCFSDSATIYGQILRYVRYVSSHKNVFFTLIKNGKLISAFMDRSNAKSNQIATRRLRIEKQEMPHLLASYTTIGSIALLETWLTYYPEYPSEKIAHIICNQALAATKNY